MSQEISQSGSTLFITGSDDSETVAIAGGVIGEVVVTSDDEVSTYTGIEIIDIDLRGGDDSLTLSALDLDGGLLSARMGGDQDSIIVTGTINADVILDGELEDDSIDLSGGVTIVGNLDVYGGIRDDVINLTGVGVQGDLWVDAQGGEDDVLYDGLFVEGRTRIDLGAGDDYAAGTGATFNDDVVIIAGLGDDDLLNAFNVYSFNLTVDMRGGADLYDELSSFIGGDFTADGGAGNDSFSDAGTVVIGSRDTKSF